MVVFCEDVLTVGMYLVGDDENRRWNAEKGTGSQAGYLNDCTDR